MNDEEMREEEQRVARELAALEAEAGHRTAQQRFERLRRAMDDLDPREAARLDAVARKVEEEHPELTNVHSAPATLGAPRTDLFYGDVLQELERIVRGAEQRERLAVQQTAATGGGPAASTGSVLNVLLGDPPPPVSTGSERSGVGGHVPWVVREPASGRRRPAAPPSGRRTDPPSGGFWGALTREEQDAFTAMATPADFPIRSVLWDEGEVGDHVLMIVEGLVNVDVVRNGRERRLAVRGPGELIGERAALLLRPRSARVTVQSPVHALRMTTQRFAAFLARHPRVLAVLERQIYNRLTDDESGGPRTPSPPSEPEREAVEHQAAPPAERTATAAPTVASTWAGQMCSILFTDIAGFSAARLSDDDRLYLRRIMYEVLHEVLDAAGVPLAACYREDRGDGALIVAPPDIAASAFVGPVPSALAARLRDHNRRAGSAVRLRLRVALHVGPVMQDAVGVSGSSIVQAARLLDARPLKRGMTESGTDLGVITSQFVYDHVIAPSADPVGYERVTIHVKKSQMSAWMNLAV
ncbi:cyclic nucleotide-binding domain-containing protein [Actinomadura sp. KC06]|uniref:cyclic nucleotide-binding domain-containing protein n=1 Tax=Actinomadura sp. KC06 TaxID=2530369 RepID=UPI001053C561|nr:cyclic nucleotide-binding domain-containing protein [Actinomadura sp. KC06]TDD34288.1 cyclic nucleotide-binding domain-containing protein [Actinomadura sp. KC06]